MKTAEGIAIMIGAAMLAASVLIPIHILLN